MDHRTRTLRWALAPLTAVAAALALAACGGGSSGDAAALLHQTFSGNHKITSGNLAFNLTVNPSGSKTLTGPISLSFSGPFQSLGAGKLPESAFDVSVTALGNTVSVDDHLDRHARATSPSRAGATSSRTRPSSGSSRASRSSAPRPAASGSGVLGKLGIQPLHWLQNPQVVGTETVGGASTTHIHAGINVAALPERPQHVPRARLVARRLRRGVVPERDLAGDAGRRSPARCRTRASTSGPAQADKTIRKLEIGLTLPVTGHRLDACSAGCARPGSG